MTRSLALVRNEKGAAAMEFALAAPVLFALIVGIAQLGILFFANAGLQNAVSAGARLATIFPVPSDDEIKAMVTSSEFGLKPENIVTDATVVRGTDANGLGYAEVSMSYKVPLHFLFFDIPPVTLTQTRRAFTQEVTSSSSSSSTSSSSTSSSSSSSTSSSTGGRQGNGNGSSGN